MIQGNQYQLENPMYRFIDKVTVNDKGCWMFPSTNRAGYAMFTFFKQPVSGHRLMYTLYQGEIPEGHEIDHLCRTRNCVNPDHLEAVTHAENMRRSKGYRRPQMHKTVCNYGHKLEGDNLVEFVEYVKGRVAFRRRCKTCKKNYKLITRRKENARIYQIG